MSAANLSVPIIDISSWVSGVTADNLNAAQMEIAKRWNEAFRDFGCAVIVGHGIPDENFTSLNNDGKTFFSKPVEEKMLYNHGKYGHPGGGFCPTGRENVAKSINVTDSTTEQIISATAEAIPDPVENFVFTSTPDNFTAPDGELKNPIPSAEVYYHKMQTLLKTLHELSCCALKMENLDFFDSYYFETQENGTAERSQNILRLSHYVSENITVDLKNVATDIDDVNRELRYGAHTDYQGYTILRPDAADWHIETLTVPLSPSSSADETSEATTVQIQCCGGGLEAQSRRTGEWIRVKIPDGMNALVVNASDLIQRWTNNYWHSLVHRVVAPKYMLLSATPVITAACADNNGQTAVTESTEMAASKSAPNLPKTLSLQSKPRQAIVFFSGPLSEKVISCLDLPHIKHNKENEIHLSRADCELVNDGNPVVRNGGVMYEPIVALDHLLMKLNRTNDV